jgi:hypothetical protein
LENSCDQAAEFAAAAASVVEDEGEGEGMETAAKGKKSLNKVAYTLTPCTLTA